MNMATEVKNAVFSPVERPYGITGPERIIYTRGLWDSGTGELMTFYTSSTQNTASKQYYYEVWGSSSLGCSDAAEFSITYGHISGSGSLSAGGEVNDTPSRAIYSQYRLLCLDPSENSFVLQDGSTVSDFYAVNFNRSKVGDKLDPGNFEISIAELNGGAYTGSFYTGSNVAVSSSNKIISLIDDSGDATDSMGYGGIPSPVRNLVSGTIANGIYNPSSPHYYGLVYADMGIIVISAKSLNASASFNTVTGSNIAGDNSMKLFKSISGSAAIGTGAGFTARAVEVKDQDFYFIRVYNGNYNYTTNPTYISGSYNDKGVPDPSGALISNTMFANEPVTYVTTIGLYNDDKELLAIAKLSKPIKKSFNSELSITVKLEY